MTYDYGGQFYTAWFQHVCGNALMQKGMSTPEPIGDVVEAILDCASSAQNAMQTNPSQ